MNAHERKDIFERAMTTKYGVGYSLLMTDKECKQYSKIIDLEEEATRSGR